MLLSSNFLKLNERRQKLLFLAPCCRWGMYSSVVLFPHIWAFLWKIWECTVMVPLTLETLENSSVLRWSFFQLRLKSKIKPCLPPVDLEKVIHAFVPNQLDYCNALYVGLDSPGSSASSWPKNVAARLLAGTRKTDHISVEVSPLASCLSQDKFSNFIIDIQGHEWLGFSLSKWPACCPHSG